MLRPRQCVPARSHGTPHNSSWRLEPALPATRVLRVLDWALEGVQRRRQHAKLEGVCVTGTLSSWRPVSSFRGAPCLLSRALACTAGPTRRWVCGRRGHLPACQIGAGVSLWVTVPPGDTLVFTTGVFPCLPGLLCLPHERPLVKTPLAHPLIQDNPILRSADYQLKFHLQP